MKLNIFTTVLLYVVFFLLGFTFTFFVFKNISYPIMWGDEAETALYAERVLDFGYPKIHKGNETYKWVMVSGDVGINKKLDANTVSMWGQYYFGAIGAYFARGTDNIYQKTADMRTPFALVGLLGAVILPLSILKFFTRSFSTRLVFYCIYFTLLILSTSLIFHLREVRSYSLTLMLVSISMIIFINYYFGTLSPKIYGLFQFVLLILLINVFPPGYLIVVGGIGSYIFLDNWFIWKRSMGINKYFNKKLLVSILPIVASVWVAVPIYIFFETSKLSSNAYADVGYTSKSYLLHISKQLVFLAKHNYLIIAIIMRYLCIKYIKYSRLSEKRIKRIYYQNKISYFLSYFFVVYVFLIALTPFLFDRYFIFLQPLISLIIICDFVILYNLVNKLTLTENIKRKAYSLGYFLFLVFIVNSLYKVADFEGFIFQLNHRYIGPMDVVIDYIKTNYHDTRSLVIDTPLEQAVLTYYLSSKTLCDDSGECFGDSPDIFIPRKGIISDDFNERTRKYLANAQYKKLLLPILDYPVNNIPEFSSALRHLYKTPYTSNDQEKLVMFVKIL